MGNRCYIKCKNEKDFMLYLQWGGEIKHILGYLDGAKQLLTELKKNPRNIAFIDLFNFGVIIQNYFGYLGCSTSIMQRTDNVVCWNNGNYIIDFNNLTIVGREITTYSNDKSNMAKSIVNVVSLNSDEIAKKINDERENDKEAKSNMAKSIANVVVLDSDEIAKEINDARENDKEAIAEVAKSIYETNLSIFS
jgi:hypothetical protein